MDSNKDEALRCITIAKEAISSGNKQRALKFIGIAHRLNKNLSLDDLLSACENLDSSIRGTSNEVKNDVASVKNETGDVMNYREEHVELIRRIKSKKDYYEILGLEKSCSVDEIRKAYRKISLKVHPDKNKAPGSEDTFKKVAKAFKCLSDVGSRREYDETSYADEFVYSQECNVGGVRRRRTGHEYSFGDEFDPDEIFRSFFGHDDDVVRRSSYVYRTRTAGAELRVVELGPVVRKLVLLLQLVMFLFIVLLVYRPYFGA
ncbi:chaperone protein dnaJ 49-like [Solanum verrucosum]|uniref:chaperone protein dnaJ 49-like n=1 Tax=Solanum verrucosum TaxID=315347 RepID=UPI0020D1B196|nr:chaperone protein dnaJ 49-like [Solanum verrucosum]